MEDQILLDLIKAPATREQGFRLLVSHYQEQLYWLIRRIVLVHDDANDVLQNVFIKIFRNIDKFEQQSKLYTWMYRIASNESISFIKKNAKHQGVSLDTDDGAFVREKLIADRFWEGDKVQLALQEAIATLPDKQKLVFQMRYYDEMSYKDMSAALETSEGALKASFHHAVNKIQEKLKQIDHYE